LNNLTELRGAGATLRYSRTPEEGGCQIEPRLRARCSTRKLDGFFVFRKERRLMDFSSRSGNGEGRSRYWMARSAMTNSDQTSASKVPEICLTFWIIKIAATTLGETGGDAVSMSMNLGYLVSTVIFAGIFLLAVSAQIKAKTFHPLLYWTTIIATTTVGTTLADFADRSLGIGYAGGSAILLGLLIASLAIWRRTLGSVAVDTVSSPKAEMFYWVTIMFSQTLGTALGDWTADDEGLGLGYSGAAAVFGGLLCVVIAAYFWTKVSRTVLFWAAFILTRPLGAVVGDFLDKPKSSGGLELSRYTASAVLLGFIAICILLFPKRSASQMPPESTSP
jgi:uncharacterized membrane-anchored protein